MKKKLFVLGIDSATWDLILEWVKQGKLKTFGKLLKEGNFSDLVSTVPFISPCAWTTITTGATPCQHGVYDFFKLKSDATLDLYTAEDIRFPFVWEILSEKGKKVAIYNIPLTYPVRKVNGIMISSILTPGFNSQFIYPGFLKEEFIKKFPDYKFAPSTRIFKDVPETFEKFYQEAKKELEDSFSVINWLIEKEKFDLFFVNIMAIDHIQHFFWHFMEKEEGFKDAIFDFYKQTDNFLQFLLQYERLKNYQFLILSDHGAGRFEGEVFLNYWLFKKGYLRFKKSFLTFLKRVAANLGLDPLLFFKLFPVSRTYNKVIKTQRQSWKINLLGYFKSLFFLSYFDIDFEKSLCFAFGEHSGIFLNQWLGREEKKRLVRKLASELSSDFKGIISDIYITEELYGEKERSVFFPDLVPVFKKGAIVSMNSYAFCGKRILLKGELYHKTGEHRRNGIFLLYPKIISKQRLKEIQSLDIAPTILGFFGFKKKKYMAGKPLF